MRWSMAPIVGLLAGAASFAQETSLCPSTWKDGEVEHYLERNRQYGVTRPGTERTSVMIGGTSGAFAIHAGAVALERGGTAMDAALTTALAQTTLCAGSWVSFAGIMYVVYYDAATGEVSCLNAGYDTVRGESDPATIPAAPVASGRTTLVPGFMTGVEVAHERFGRLPFASLFEPAIYLAERGFPIDAMMARLIAGRHDALSRREETRDLFTTGADEFLREGDHFEQPALARTLKRVATGGAVFMREGEWAEKLVRVVREEGGRLGMEDLATYKATWERPITTSYRGYEVAALPPPELGPTMVLEGLTLLEKTKIGEPPHYTEDVEKLFRFIQIARLSYVLSYAPGYALNAEDEKDGRLGPARRISAEHSDEMFAELSSGDWSRGWEARLWARYAVPSAETHESHSDGVVVVDAEGNVCALVHSINTHAWGSTGIFVDGVSIPDSASFQQSMIARVGPGRRLPNITNPVLVLEDGRPVLAASVIGSALHECMLQNLVNVLDFGMTPQESVDRAKFWGPFVAADGSGSEWSRHTVEARLGDELIQALIDRGQAVERTAQGTSFFVGIRLGPTGLSGGGTQRFNGIFEGSR